MFDKLFNELRILVFAVAVVTLFACCKDVTMRARWYVQILLLFTAGLIGMQILGYAFEWMNDFNKIREYSISGTLLHPLNLQLGFLRALFPYVLWTLYSLLLMYVVVVRSENPIFMTLTILASIAALVVIFFSPTMYGSANRVLGVSSVLLSLVAVHTILKKNLVQTPLQIILYSCIPIINVASLFVFWIQSGFEALM